MIELLFGTLLTAVLTVITQWAGRALLFVISFGRWRGERLFEREAKIYGASGALWFRRDGQIVLTFDALIAVGVVADILIVALVVLALSLKP